MLKKRSNLIFSCLLVLALTIAFVYAQMDSSPVPVAVLRPAEASGDQLPPAGGTPDRPFPYVNEERLAKLAADPKYKGPSFKADYTTPEVLQAAKERQKDRLPASSR